jgi:hypothetical protein
MQTLPLRVPHLRVGLDLLADVHGAELGATHGAEVRSLGRLLQQQQQQQQQAVLFVVTWGSGILLASRHFNHSVFNHRCAACQHELHSVATKPTHTL